MDGSCPRACALCREDVSPLRGSDHLFKLTQHSAFGSVLGYDIPPFQGWLISGSYHRRNPCPVLTRTREPRVVVENGSSSRSDHCFKGNHPKPEGKTSYVQQTSSLYCYGQRFRPRHHERGCEGAGRVRHSL